MQKSYRLYSNLPHLGTRRVFAKVSVKALQENYLKLSGFVLQNAPKDRPPTIVSVVKADAYGHGIPICVPALLEVGCRSFAVATPEEGAAVREICDARQRFANVFLLSPCQKNDFWMLDRYRLSAALGSFAQAKELSAFARSRNICLPVLLALDSGMHRLGIDCANPTLAAEELFKIKNLPCLSVKGVFSHFARADEFTESANLFTQLQFSRFVSVVSKASLPAQICNSAAALRFPEYYLDAVRLGIALYGASPILSMGEDFPTLSPVLSLHSYITALRSVPPHEPIGYGSTYARGIASQIATVPVGYADGFLRAYSNTSVQVETSSGSFFAPIAGKICMDQLTLDVTGLPVAIGDSVTLFSNACDISSASKMIPYEVLCAISARVPRIKE